jgi:hypothetical protein
LLANIKPLVTFTLADLEKAIRPQFVFSYQRYGETEQQFQQRIKGIHRLSTCPIAELNESMALLVFVGLAQLYGFHEDKVMNYLIINETKYTTLINQYERYQKKDKKLPCEELYKIYFSVGGG